MKCPDCQKKPLFSEVLIIASAKDKLIEVVRGWCPLCDIYTEAAVIARETKNKIYGGKYIDLGNREVIDKTGVYKVFCSLGSKAKRSRRIGDIASIVICWTLLGGWFLLMILLLIFADFCLIEP